MSLITNGPIGPTPPSLSLSLSLLLFPLSTTLPASLPSCPCTSRQSVPKKQKPCPDNASLFSRCSQPSGLLISNLFNRWKPKGAVDSFCLAGVCKSRRNKTACKATNKPHSKSVVCVVWFICLAATNSEGGMYASNRLSLLTAGKVWVYLERWWRKKEGSHLQSAQ